MPGHGRRPLRTEGGELHVVHGLVGGTYEQDPGFGPCRDPGAVFPGHGSTRYTPIPIIFDTDIGSDIDDAFALALIVNSPELELRGVTTVSGDTRARARLAAKLLWEAGGSWRRVPVYAGKPGTPQPVDQTRWAEGFSSPALHPAGAVDFMRAEINREPGKLTIVAVGELTNAGGGQVAALLNPTLSLPGKSSGSPSWEDRLHAVMPPVQSLTRNGISSPTLKRPRQSFHRECPF